MPIRPTAFIAFLIAAWIPLLFTSTAWAQNCSCAGAPLVSSQSGGASSAGHWIVGVTYEFHEIAALYSGTERLENQETARNTQTALVEVSYGITDRLSVSGTISSLRKERETGLGSPERRTAVSTTGIGDGMVTLDYDIVEQSLWNRFGWTLTGGAKVPFGSTSRTNGGFQMNADMQPGTGAWDGVVGTQFSVSLLPLATVNVFADGTYRRTGANERFNENDVYEFGNEFISFFGFVSEIDRNFSYTMQMRYRMTTQDERNGQKMPNTGGSWYTLEPNVSYNVNDRVGLSVSGRLPVYQDMNGMQPTTSYAVSGSLFINFNQQGQDFTYGRPR